RRRSSNAASISPRARVSILSLASRLGRAPLTWARAMARSRCKATSLCSARCRASKRGWIPLLPRQNFPLNLPPNRRLCSTVGGRIVEGWPAARGVVAAARSRAATMTNLARSSLALVLSALFGAAKSCALVKFFMICPRWSSSRQPTTNQIVLLITAISWHLCEHVEGDSRARSSSGGLPKAGCPRCGRYSLQRHAGIVLGGSCSGKLALAIQAGQLLLGTPAGAHEVRDHERCRQKTSTVRPKSAIHAFILPCAYQGD